MAKHLTLSKYFLDVVVCSGQSNCRWRLTHLVEGIRPLNKIPLRTKSHDRWSIWPLLQDPYLINHLRLLYLVSLRGDARHVQARLHCVELSRHFTEGVFLVDAHRGGVILCPAVKVRVLDVFFLDYSSLLSGTVFHSEHGCKLWILLMWHLVA